MKRKLVQQGAATLMVSLPAKWAKKNNLGKGSEVDVEEKDDLLVIGTQKILGKTQTTITLVGNTETHIRTMITNTYRMGFDKITVLFNSQTQFSVLSKIVKLRLIGFDITSVEKNSCVVENITEPSDMAVEQILQKVFLNIDLQFAATKQLLVGEDSLESVDEIQERVQKYDNFVRRCLLRNGVTSKSVLLWSFLTLLVHANRELYLLSKQSKSVSKKTILLFDDVHKMFSLLENAFAKKDVYVLSKLHDLEKDIIYSQGYAELQKSKDGIVLYHLLSCARQLYQANSPLVGFLLS